MLYALVLALSLGSLALGYRSPRPVVVWHGLGDSHSSPGMLDFMEGIKQIHPGIFVHSVYIEEELDKDRQAGFYGNVNTQVDLVADQLASIPELEGGFDAIGFSQGGQFLRAYVERYNAPPVHNLITFGSQHMGVSDIPECNRFDFVCQAARRVAKGAVYGQWAQENIIQAQYFRDPTRLETYLKVNTFLADINNELPDARNASYTKNLESLNKLVLVMFTEDKTVVPKESGWFGAEEIVDEQYLSEFSESRHQIPLTRRNAKNILPMQELPIYKEDWIGLRALDERGGVVFETCKGEHMRLGDCWVGLVANYTGGTE